MHYPFWVRILAPIDWVEIAHGTSRIRLAVLHKDGFRKMFGQEPLEGLTEEWREVELTMKVKA